MITTADALAYCMAQPGADAGDCHDAVAAQTVGGAYCDGDVVLTAGAPPRCVPTGTLAAKRAAEQKAPLPAPSAPQAPGPGALAIVGAALVLGASIALLRTR